MRLLVTKVTKSANLGYLNEHIWILAQQIIGYGFWHDDQYDAKYTPVKVFNPIGEVGEDMRVYVIMRDGIEIQIAESGEKFRRMVLEAHIELIKLYKERIR